MLARRLVMIVVVAAAAVAGGCGASSKQQAIDDWQMAIGPSWEAFTRGYERGWVAGCDAAVQRAIAAGEDPSSIYIVSGCGLGTSGPTSSLDVPLEPPEDPDSAGYHLGKRDGCVSANTALDRRVDPCFHD